MTRLECVSSKYNLNVYTWNFIDTIHINLFIGPLLKTIFWP